MEEGLARPLKIARLSFRERPMSFALSGNGKFPARLLVNGIPIRGTRKIPISAFGETTDIVCERTNVPPGSPLILTLHGGVLHSVETRLDRLAASISGWGHILLTFYSPSLPVLMLGGESLCSEYDPATGEGSAMLQLSASEAVSLEILAPSQHVTEEDKACAVPSAHN